jgi:hypothetical protein
VTQSLATTRRSWHAVAELILAGPQYRRSGTIRLRAVPGGFATIAEPEISVELGTVAGAGARVPIDGHSCAELAAALGVDAGAPADLYHDGCGVAADEVLAVDAAALATLADALDAGDAALRAFAPGSTPVLWPEHFDIGITADEVNYGVSPGDGYLGEPYAYVGPWQPRTGPLWNAPFGAARPLRELPEVADVVAFFVDCRDS